MRRQKITKPLKILVRILLILGVAYTGFLVIYLTPYWLAGIWINVFAVLLIVELIRYYERSQRALREFLAFVSSGDLATVSRADEKNEEFKAAYELLYQRFRNLQIEKETNYQYLNLIVEHVDTALICLDSDTNVKLINRAALKLLQVPEIRKLSVLKKVDKDLMEAIKHIKTGEKELVRSIRHSRMLKLSLRATEFKMDGQLFKIVSLHDIKTELEEQEVESWHKLVRVITHEIMNSAIPITNMISMSRQILQDKQGKVREIPGLGDEELDDLILSLSTAESRSQGLASFVENTKKLSRIPEPAFEDIKVGELFKRIGGLFKKDISMAGVNLDVNVCPDDLTLKADKDLLEQVLINLVRNALHAIDGVSGPVIKLSAGRTFDGEIWLSITDNGCGIPRENLEQVFIPFFSTKKEGSGIGLSLALQIMKLHKGRIDLKSEQNQGTSFTLEF